MYGHQFTDAACIGMTQTLLRFTDWTGVEGSTILDPVGVVAVVSRQHPFKARQDLVGPTAHVQWVLGFPLSSFGYRRFRLHFKRRCGDGVVTHRDTDTEWSAHVVVGDFPHAGFTRSVGLPSDHGQGLSSYLSRRDESTLVLTKYQGHVGMLGPVHGMRGLHPEEEIEARFQLEPFPRRLHRDTKRSQLHLVGDETIFSWWWWTDRIRQVDDVLEGSTSGVVVEGSISGAVVEGFIAGIVARHHQEFEL